MSHSDTLTQLIEETIPNPTMGAEIGVERGQTSYKLLQHFPSLRLYLVDPWQEWEEGSTYRAIHKRSGDRTQEEWDQVYNEAVNLLSSYIDDMRCRIHRTISKQAVKQFPDRFFDFVFIDGNHSYESVFHDIRLWMPKVKIDGLLAGHDYSMHYKGVKRATHELIGKENLIVRSNRIWGYVVR